MKFSDIPIRIDSTLCDKDEIWLENSDGATKLIYKGNNMSKEKKIQTYNDLKRFILATLDAHGNMISTNEAAIAIEKAFVEFRENFSARCQESINNLSQYF